jgi:ferritin-like metal-binding protein YciE
MSRSEQKVLHSLEEAHASELALARVLQSQIMMTPRGRYRQALETHLEETRGHARRLKLRMGELGRGREPLGAALGLIEGAVGQMLALGKTPLDLLRGSGGEEKVLKNAKDACATEALEIATYTAIERLATSVGDEDTARLARSIRAEEERMLDRILREIPRLTKLVVDADIDGAGSYDITETGAADALREASEHAGDAARSAGKRARRSARSARRVPGVARAEGLAKGAAASEGDLAIAGYDDLTAGDISDRLSGLSQIELARVEAYERRHQGRSTVLSKVAALRSREPWPGYDEQNADEIRTLLAAGDDRLAATVRTYERGHKNRRGVMAQAEREHAAASA